MSISRSQSSKREEATLTRTGKGKQIINTNYYLSVATANHSLTNYVFFSLFRFLLTLPKAFGSGRRKQEMRCWFPGSRTGLETRIIH